MSNDKMREEFETAVALEAGEPVLAVYLSRRNETYSTSTLHFAWWAWKTSREALLKQQLKEQEEFLDHLADFESEETFHG